MNDLVSMKVFHPIWDQLTRTYQIESGILKGVRTAAVTVDIDGIEHVWNIYETFPSAESINKFMTLSDELNEARRALQRLTNEVSAERAKFRDMLYPSYGEQGQ